MFRSVLGKKSVGTISLSPFLFVTIVKQQIRGWSIGHSVHLILWLSEFKSCSRVKTTVFIL